MTEREKIADLQRAGLSLRAIGRELNRSASTIMREIAAYTVAGWYLPHGAAVRARPKAAKLAQSGPLRDYVMDGLQRRWSPEQLRNHIREEHPDDEGMRVSTETIYRALSSRPAAA